MSLHPDESLPNEHKTSDEFALNNWDDFETDSSVDQLEDFILDSPEPEVTRVSIEDLADRDTGFGRVLHRLRDESAEGLAPTGGDLDTNQYQSKVSGEEAVGGSAPTPDQNVVDDLASSEGIESPDGHPLRTFRLFESRDAHRWELEPESSEDYQEHASDLS